MPHRRTFNTYDPDVDFIFRAKLTITCRCARIKNIQALAVKTLSTSRACQEIGRESQ